MFWGALRWRAEKRLAEVVELNKLVVAYVTSVAERLAEQGKVTRKMTEDGAYGGYEFPVSDRETFTTLLRAALLRRQMFDL